MSDEEKSERVVMMWPKSLKDAVREVAGPRGLTEFVSTAVEEALQRVKQSDTDESENPVSENEHASETTPSEAPEREPASETVTLGPLNKTSKAAAPPEVPPKPVQDRDDLFARLMAKTGGDLDLETLKGSLKPASEIAKPEPKLVEPPVTQEVCPTCGEELVNGECWTCS